MPVHRKRNGSTCSASRRVRPRSGTCRSHRRAGQGPDPARPRQPAPRGPRSPARREHGAASVDHVYYTTQADIDALAQSSTVATLLPGADFSTRNKYPDARALLDAGVTVALGADCNPGTSYTTSLPFCIAIAVRDMHMTPDEAIWAATAGGASALQRDDIGVLRPGARADALALDAPSYLHLAYRPGVPLVGDVWQGGELAWSAHTDTNK